MASHDELLQGFTALKAIFETEQAHTRRDLISLGSKVDKLALDVTTIKAQIRGSGIIGKLVSGGVITIIASMVVYFLTKV